MVPSCKTLTPFTTSIFGNLAAVSAILTFFNYLAFAEQIKFLICRSNSFMVSSSQSSLLSSA